MGKKFIFMTNLKRHRAYAYSKIGKPKQENMPSCEWIVMPTKTTTADSSLARYSITWPLKRKAASPHKFILISSPLQTKKKISGIRIY
jgi:hypothetical protein